jgi:hypothetical protein|tara:strand:+ start:3149 stop:3313 length:165 start_codon:yes stop_codon:yes gene_type:complete
MEVLEMVDKIKRVEKLCLQTIRDIKVSTKKEKHFIRDSYLILLADEVLTIIEGK